VSAWTDEAGDAFDQLAAEVGVPLTWQPPAGPLLTVNVLYKAPGVDVLNNRMTAADCRISYRTGALPGLHQKARVTIDGAPFLIREARPVDAVTSEATLNKA
jgi:hypothetical protein